MNITLLYFAAAREQAGLSRETVELPAGSTAAQARARAIELHPGLAGLASQLRIAVDQVFARDGDALPDGAEVALIPPVSGGL